MRPSIATFSPLTPGGAKLSVMSQVSPICRYGPIVCDDVVWRLIVVPPRLRLSPLRSALGPQRGSSSRRRIVTRAAGGGPRDAGIDGQCESSHEADSRRND